MSKKRENIPLPGTPVRGSDTGRSIMAALDLLGRRWTLRILWELQSGPQGFRQLQKSCDNMSPSVLDRRLKELKAAQILEQTPDTMWTIAPLGLELSEKLRPLNEWSKKWQAHLEK
ncbi:helix-turn-helix domain-containing protein [Kordiimonas sp. SCSIO 12603]|uniref:winged helix-turn-helix transcriptional regulator n=1 Tax=Kordiimonas sp. SCSIO 12603 TaxID=2829596 RepID=UPI002102D2AE|nr:helix-turn-helix domain-containing protein [Kordiimonas sp. SCSIO 12603]